VNSAACSLWDQKNAQQKGNFIPVHLNISSSAQSLSWTRPRASKLISMLKRSLEEERARVRQRSQLADEQLHMRRSVLLDTSGRRAKAAQARAGAAGRPGVHSAGPAKGIRRHMFRGTAFERYS